MIDTWLIIVIIVCFLLMLLLNAFVLAYFLHPDDKGFINGLFEKLIIFLGFAVLWTFVLLLPLDIANSRGAGSGLNIHLAYMVLFGVLLAFLLLILPWVSSFYESDSDDSCCVRFFKSFMYTLVILSIVFVMGFIFWKHIPSPGIQVATKVAHIQGLEFIEQKASQKIIALNQSAIKKIPYKPNFIFIIIFFLLLIGWILFVFFAGVGIVALPLDMILDYMYR